ncbi:MAG: hypothetical protein IPI77_16875 [Saprospiraceae bacterium]|nr:hypothetical protein [Saprospiraceae bacterium]
MEASNLSVPQILLQYQLNYILINGLLWPVFSQFSVIFFTSRLAYNAETISILNAGVSFKRLLLPYLVAANGLVMLAFISQSLYHPFGQQT